MKIQLCTRIIFSKQPVINPTCEHYLNKPNRSIQMVQDLYSMVGKPTLVYSLNHHKSMGYNGTFIFHRVTV